MSRRLPPKSSGFKPTVSICIFTHGEYDIKTPSICLDTCGQKSKTTSRPFLSMDFSKCASNIICLAQSKWNEITDINPFYEIRDEDISVEEKRDGVRIIYTFPTPIGVNYLENQATYKTLSFDAKIVDIPKKFVMLFSSIFRYAGIYTRYDRKEEHINSRKLIEDIKSGKRVCLTDYPGIKRVNEHYSRESYHTYIQTQEEPDELFERIKCSPSIRERLLNKRYCTDPIDDLNIRMVMGSQEIVLLDTTFKKNVVCMNRLMQKFNLKGQHQAIRKFYDNIIVDDKYYFKVFLAFEKQPTGKIYAEMPHLFYTTSIEIIELLSGLFPYGANLNWYDTSCNSIKGLKLLNTVSAEPGGISEMSSKVPSHLHDRYIRMIGESLEAINNGLNRVHGLAFGGTKSKRRKFKKNKNI